MDEYKAGFREISNMVEQFEELSAETQEMIIKEKLQFLEEQLCDLQKKKSGYWHKNRVIIAQINSRFKAFADSEKSFQEQMAECNEFLVIISKRTAEPISEGAGTTDVNMQV